MAYNRDMNASRDHVGSPPLALERLLGTNDSSPLRISFTHVSRHLEGAPEQTLHAACFHTPETGLVAAIDTDGDRLGRGLARCNGVPDAAHFYYDLVHFERPLPLSTVRIPKPWGAEIWYTGIEARGVCGVGNVPLPWILDLGGGLVHGGAGPEPVLLKILDPLAEPVYGDLYFEMHEQKIEVYVVTDVSTSAWPDGTGAIRFGFDQRRIAEFDSVDAFSRAWLDKVREYRALRERIDGALDERRAREGIAANAVVEPATLEAWQANLDPALIEDERRVREEMNSFTAMEPLRPGDVVRVPPFTPHSLQHGVRVIEFQTPHYERYILSFAQKVLTQDHWDTEEAASHIDWHAGMQTELETLSDNGEVRVEQAADFDAFEVHRVTLTAGASWQTATHDAYALILTVYGDLAVDGRPLAPEEAVMIPATLPHTTITAAEAACVLVAIPKPNKPADNMALTR